MYSDCDLESSRSVSSLHRCNSLRRTLYHLHNRETFPYSTKDNFDRCPVIHSWITIVPSCQTYSEVHDRSGTQHSILYRMRHREWLFILFLFSAMVGFWVLLNFTPCNTGKNSFFDSSILNYFKILSRFVLIEKTYQAPWSISIDLDAQYVSSFTEVFLWKTPFKHSFMLSRKFYIISDQQYVIHIYLLERL